MVTDKTHFTVCGTKLRRRSLKLTVYDDFFNGEIVYKVTNNSIEFTKPKLNDRKNILYPHKTKYGNAYHFTISEDLDIEHGSHNFEEIEDEDIRIFIIN